MVSSKYFLSDKWGESIHSLHEEEMLLNQKQPVPAKQHTCSIYVTTVYSYIECCRSNFEVILFEVFRTVQFNAAVGNPTMD